jgi:hypothetical protein
LCWPKLISQLNQKLWMESRIKSQSKGSALRSLSKFDIRRSKECHQEAQGTKMTQLIRVPCATISSTTRNGCNNSDSLFNSCCCIVAAHLRLASGEDHHGGAPQFLLSSTPCFSALQFWLSSTPPWLRERKECLLALCPYTSFGHASHKTQEDPDY